MEGDAPSRGVAGTPDPLRRNAFALVVKNFTLDSSGAPRWRPMNRGAPENA
jgi:hypothetical protein